MVGRIDVGAFVEEQADDRFVAAPGRRAQRRVALGAAAVDVRPMIEKGSDGMQVALAGGPHEDPALLVAAPHGLGVAAAEKPVQQRHEHHRRDDRRAGHRNLFRLPNLSFATAPVPGRVSVYYGPASDSRIFGRRVL